MGYYCIAVFDQKVTKYMHGDFEIKPKVDTTKGSIEKEKRILEDKIKRF